MFYLLLLILVLVSNGQLAAKKGHSIWLWGFITLISFFVFQSVFGFLLVAAVYHGPMNPVELGRFLEANPLTLWTIILFGVGGGLLIRYIIERLPVNRNTD